jgi:hypothetical protein
MTEENNDQLRAIARLEVQLSTVLDRLGDVSSNMVTKDLYTAQNANVEFRFRTVEDQLVAWRTESTAAHVELEAGSKARNESVKAESNARKKEIEDRLDKAEERAYQLEQAQKAQRSNKILQYSLVALGFVGSIIASFFIAVINNGITPAG